MACFVFDWFVLDRLTDRNAPITGHFGCLELQGWVLSFRERSGSWIQSSGAGNQLGELDSELWSCKSARGTQFRARELEIQSSRSWNSRARGAVLGAGPREAIAEDFVTYNQACPRGQKEKVWYLIQVPREAQK